MKQYNGNRLRLARLYNGFTVEELARKVNISPQAESQYELGTIQPQFDKMVLLANVLNFPVPYFFQKEDLHIATGAAYFRSLMKTPKKYRTEQRTKISFLAKIYSVLDEYISFPEIEIPQKENYSSPQEAAKYLRDYWKLNDKPVTNVLRLLEAHGIVITSFKTTTDDIDAFSQLFKFDEKYFFVIAYSNNKNSAARINFDLAHELGHIILHPWSDDTEDTSREDFKNKEKEANDFAAAFLLPESSFLKDIRFYPTELQNYIELKRKWHVSIGAMLHRACELKAITTSQYQYLIRIMNAKGIKKNEPLDNILEIPYPSLLKDSVNILVANGVFSKNELLNEFANSGLSMKGNEVEKLLVLDKGYFEETTEDVPLSISLKPRK